MMKPYLPCFALLLAVFGLLWFFIPIFSGIPWIPTGKKRIQAGLKLSGIQPDELFYDLGCGDGRVLIEAARQYQARAVGIEISWLHCLVAKARIRIAGAGPQTIVRWGNIYRTDLQDADVVYWYGHSRFAHRLKEQLQRQLRPGARLISINVELPGWQPAAFDRVNQIYLYRMPPPSGNLASFLMKEQAREKAN